MCVAFLVWASVSAPAQASACAAALFFKLVPQGHQLKKDACGPIEKFKVDVDKY